MSGKDDPTWVGEATYVGDATYAEDGGQGTDEVPLLAGRYRVGRLLGRGGTGQVHEAVDTTSDEVVAIKFVALRTTSARRQLRQELTALRLLALPGVVRLFDDGEQGDQTFLVMELLSGGPFDALASRGWEGWQEQARALLESLARVHFSGVLHLDLKPGNILLDAAGWPVITDFGLARGKAVHQPDKAPREGTPRYMAPEQWLGATLRPSTDLYAVGGMFWEMLARRPLPQEPAKRVLPRGCAPDDVVEMVERMLAEDPSERPQSAVEVLDALFDSEAVLGPTSLGLAPMSTEEQLQALLDEEQPSFLYLARDAAAVLHQATKGEVTAVRRELDRWVRGGLAWWNGDRVHIERPAIEQLRWGLDPESQRLAELAREAPEKAVERSLGLSRELWADGQSARAFGVLEATLPLARALGRAAEVVDRLVVIGLDRRSELRRLRHQATREGSPFAIRLTDATAAQQRGDWAAAMVATEQALQHASTEWQRLTCIASRVHAASPLGASALRLELGDEPGVLPLSVWHQGQGWLAYVEGNYGIAAEHHRKAAWCEQALNKRLAHLSNAAAAAVELADLGDAEAILGLFGEALEGRDQPMLAVRYHWLSRLVGYRAGTCTEPRPEFVRAAERVSERMGAQLALLEGAIAWRAGEHSVAREMCTTGCKVLRRDGHRAAEALGRALQFAAGGHDEKVAELLGDIEAVRPAEFAVQVLALLRTGGIDVGSAWRPLLEEARTTRGGRQRLDVLSLDEAEAMLIGQGAKTGPNIPEESTDCPE